MSIKYLGDSTARSFRTQGLRRTLTLTRSFIGNKFFPKESDETVRRFRLGQRLSQTFNHTVAYGPFKGLILSNTSWWGAADRGSMLLGIYEREVLETLENASRGRRTFIDIGAADGYYAVGALAANMFDQATCFEISPAGQEAILENARRNSVESRIKIFGEVTGDSLALLSSSHDIDLSETVILMDIEGLEFEILSEAVLTKLQKSILIIEIHDWEAPSATSIGDLQKSAEKFFQVSWLTTGDRNLSVFPELVEWPDDDRWILCSESRRKLMKWLVLTPLAS